MTNGVITLTCLDSCRAGDVGACEDEVVTVVAEDLGISACVTTYDVVGALASPQVFRGSRVCSEDSIVSFTSVYVLVSRSSATTIDGVTGYKDVVALFTADDIGVLVSSDIVVARASPDVIVSVR